MTPYRKSRIAQELYFAYCDAENHVEKMKLKDVAFELGILIGESLMETRELNSVTLLNSMA
jgi:hypothetical protein